MRGEIYSCFVTDHGETEGFFRVVLLLVFAAAQMVEVVLSSIDIGGSPL